MCRVVWWLSATVLVGRESNGYAPASFSLSEDISGVANSTEYIQDDFDQAIVGSDISSGEVAGGSLLYSLWSAYSPSLYVLAVAVMVFLQMKSFLQSLHLLAKLGFALQRAGKYTLFIIRYFELF